MNKEQELLYTEGKIDGRNEVLQAIPGEQKHDSWLKIGVGFTLSLIGAVVFGANLISLI